MNIHDSAYKKLFSNLIFARDLLIHFVEEPWVHRLDFDRAIILDKSFIADQYKETEADLIYQVPIKGTDKVIYLYLLIEFQSTVDRFMVVRVGRYIHSFYLEYRDSTEKVKLLPQIFPIVLYNGNDTWTAATELSKLVEQNLDLAGYGVQVRYSPVIINQIPLEKLLAEENIVATLFIAEGRYNVNLLLEKLLALYEAGEHKAVSLLTNWYRQMRVHKRVSEADYALLEQQIRSKEEIKLMIVETIEKAEEEILRKGKVEGKRDRNREIAQNMIAQNYSLAAIANVLALSEAEVQNLLTSSTDSAQVSDQ